MLFVQVFHIHQTVRKVQDRGLQGGDSLLLVSIESMPPGRRSDIEKSEESRSGVDYGCFLDLFGIDTGKISFFDELTVHFTVKSDPPEPSSQYHGVTARSKVVH
jgi:hypothetical protein